MSLAPVLRKPDNCIHLISPALSSAAKYSPFDAFGEIFARANDSHIVTSVVLYTIHMAISSFFYIIFHLLDGSFSNLARSRGREEERPWELGWSLSTG